MNTDQSSPALARVVHFFETLSLESTAQLGTIYAADAFFKDPFNEVHGLAAIRPIFEHMFQQVEAPRFIVTLQMQQGDDAFMTWDFRFKMRRFSAAEQCIRGATQLKFDANGLVSYHRDYWDAAEELYEKLPLLGSLMRWLKRRANQA
ncbi:MAG: nuclear transport factor 2 family protein [Pseudomonadota bacterium]